MKMKPGKKTGEEKKEKNLLKQHLNANQNRNLVKKKLLIPGNFWRILYWRTTRDTARY